ncbi:MAG: hypothetical protein HQL37_06230 [Alphaproteobacteria bacterium]|nr:hypothetical protein [Alphaproteobacteria bacterium]
MSVATSGWTPKETPKERVTEEHFFRIAPHPGNDFADQAGQVFELYEAALQETGQSTDSLVTATVFLSDSANQEAVLRSHPGFVRQFCGGGTVSVVQQPPSMAKIGLLAYHVRRPSGRERRTTDAVTAQTQALSVEAGPYRFIYLNNVLPNQGISPTAQADDVFGFVGTYLQAHGLSWAEVVRTWLYINDIDTHYAAISQARNQVFRRCGLDGRSGFPASTGINGRLANPFNVMMLNLVAIQGLQPGQCRAMTAPGNMNPTTEYGVTFERGREVVYGDRRHLYISGTASIDQQGQILHSGDPRRQTERVIENIAALLRHSNASLAAMRYLIVYLRDRLDAGTVETVIEQTPLASVPRLLVFAPICRPGWLVEMEGMAIDGQGDARFAAY